MSKKRIDSHVLTALAGAATEVVQTIANETPVPGKHYSKLEGRTWGAVTGLVALNASPVSGYLIISFNENAVLPIVSGLLMEQIVSLNAEVVDAVGEITNMVCGHTKKELSKFKHDFEMTRPKMITGKDVSIPELANCAVSGIEMTTKFGKFVVETTFEDDLQASARKR